MSTGACIFMASPMNQPTLERQLPAIYLPEQERPQPRYAPGKAPIVPPGSVTGRSLVVVIAIMGFLACLTTGIVYLINKQANIWLHGVISEVTIRVMPDGTSDETEKNANEVVKFLTGQVGVETVRLQTIKQTAELVEPWLGKIAAIQDLPLPRVIEVKVTQNNAPDMAALRAALNGKFPNAFLEDHRTWQKQIRRVTGSLALGGILLILLVAAATVGTIVSAARSAITSNRDIIEVLHFVGAEERFIARQFELHFLKLGIKAGVTGAAAATAIFLILPFIADFMSGAGTQVEFRRLFGSGYLDMYGYACLLAVVVVIAAICQLTSRYGVRHILNLQNQ